MDPATSMLSRRLRTPKVGEYLERALDRFWLIVDVCDNGERILVAPATEKRPHSFARRSDIMWDPRGWWRHATAAASAATAHRLRQRDRLFRVNNNPNEFGRRCSAGVLNLAIARQAMQATTSAPSRLALFAANASRDPSFVLASPMAVDAQNRHAPSPVHRWTCIEQTPLSSVQAGTTSSCVQLSPVSRKIRIPSRSSSRSRRPSSRDQFCNDPAVEIARMAAWEELQRSMGSRTKSGKELRKQFWLLRHTDRRPLTSELCSADAQAPTSRFFALTALPTST